MDRCRRTRWGRAHIPAFHKPSLPRGSYPESAAPDRTPRDLRLRWGQASNVGILVVAECTGVAGRIVGESPNFRIHLQHVEPVATERFKARIALDAGYLGMNCGYIECVYHPPVFR